MEGTGDRKAVHEGDLETINGTVDSECDVKENIQLLHDGNDDYNVVLTQTYFDENKNKNKYYIIQIHEDSTTGECYVWCHWGRVGYKGRHMKKERGLDKNQAIGFFAKKFKEKTGNKWIERATFQKKSEKYDLMKTRGNPELEGEHVAIARKMSNLPREVQELMILIFSTEIMENTIEAMGYNLEKAPLGTMTHQQILDGYAALRTISQCILHNEPEENLSSACGKYYTKIPHKFGMKKPSLINKMDQIQSELELLESLRNIHIAMLILKEPSEDDNPIDRQYSELECDLKPLQNTDEVFQMVDRYLKDTHAQTHDDYRMEILDLFEVTKDDLTFHDVKNRQLLWHGSRLTNWAGILKEGLRIAPPEAPNTGDMFGKGVYFADRSSKACNYCKVKEEPYIGLALLCEVALGESNILIKSDEFADQLPPGKHSVKALGQTEPDPDQNIKLGETLVPLGKGILVNESEREGRELLYNEYIVYNTKQIKMRYLVKIKFNSVP